MPAPRGMASQHLWTFERGVSEDEIFISSKKGEILSYMKLQTKARLQSKTYVFKNNIENGGSI